MALNPEKRRTRAIMDHASVEAICGDIITAEAFRSTEDRKPLSNEDARAGQARAYIATYNFPTLAGRGTLRSGARVRFDLTNGDYPHGPPNAQVVGWKPWLPHVHMGSGLVCIGPSWSERRGRYVLADLVLHIARILNAEEPSTMDAFEPATVEYLWREYQGGPINRDLALPFVPPEVVHGTIAPAAGSFTMVRRPVASVASASASVGNAAPGLFRRVGAGGGP